MDNKTKGIIRKIAIVLCVVAALIIVANAVKSTDFYKEHFTTPTTTETVAE